MIPGQVIESVELQRHAKAKGPNELGGKSFERWLGEWAQRWRDGEQIAVLVDRDSTHAVVIRTSTPNWRSASAGLRNQETP